MSPPGTIFGVDRWDNWLWGATFWRGSEAPSSPTLLPKSLCHPVDVFSPHNKTTSYLWSTHFGDFLSLRDIFCPFGKDTLSNPVKAIPVSARALAWAELLKEAKRNFPWPSTFQRKHQDHRAKIVYLGYWIYFGCNKYFGFLPDQFANENTDPRFSDCRVVAILKNDKVKHIPANKELFML